MSDISVNELLPVLPLRDMVVFPHGVHPLFVGTPTSIAALEAAMADDKQILLVAKRDAEVKTPTAQDLYDVGTVATVLQLLKLPDGTVKVLVEGGNRARMLELIEAPDHLTCRVESVPEPEAFGPAAEAVAKNLMQQFEKFVEASKKVPSEVLSSLASIDDPARLADTMAAQMSPTHRRSPAGARSLRSQGPIRRRAGSHRRPARRGADGKTHSRPRQKTDGEEPARVLPQRADEGDSERVGRHGGHPQRDRSAGQSRSKSAACPRRRATRRMPSSTS